MAKKKSTKKAAAKKPAAKKAGKKPAKKASSREMLIVGSKSKDALKNGGKFMVSSDTLAALNEHVYWLIDQAQKRAAANGRKTIRPYDILA